MRTYAGTLVVAGSRIARLTETSATPDDALPYLLPGFVDAHVHIESSMLTPCQFARLAVVHGTVATVSDPHEIGNVLGAAGVAYMLKNAAQVPFKFCFGAPSCVPATPFETAGAIISAADIEQLFAQYPQIGYLAEVMNFPGVLHGDPDVLAKIALAQRFGKPVDGHAPGLRGEQARQYAAAGITTDHECFTREEALDKLACGMHILIREGSAAKNFDALIGLLPEHADRLMFCSDDKHPDSLVAGHINQLVRRALALGHNLYQVLRVACLNPVLHYRLPVGLLRPGDPADFIVVDNWQEMNVLQTWLDGQLVAAGGQSRLPSLPSRVVNQFRDDLTLQPDQLAVPAADPLTTSQRVRVVEALDGQLITNLLVATLPVTAGLVQPDLAADVLKMVVVNRYHAAPPAVAFVKNFGLRRGAIASTVAHDSHNVIAVGADDAAICEAVNLLARTRGGVAAVDGSDHALLPLPIAGLMSGEDGYAVAAQYAALDAFAKRLGGPLQAPFMTLSFMALLVIPALKLSDRGLFDGDQFAFIPLLVE